MRLKRIVVFCFLFCFVNIFFAQKNTELIFQPMFGNSPLVLSTYYKINTTDSLQITALKFYVSDLELWKDQKLVYKEKKSYHLIDVDKRSSLNFFLNTPVGIEFNEIKFNLGIDSITNVSGALGGDLDPTNGMYWTWQSGYINFKLEGNSNLCKGRNNEFQFHLGGYKKPFLALQTIKLKTEKSNRKNIQINIQKLIETINLGEQNHIMSPCKEAISLAEKVTKTISIN